MGALPPPSGADLFAVGVEPPPYNAKQEFTAQSNDTERVREVTITNAPCTHLLSVITDKREFIIGYEVEMALRKLLMAPFSNRDTWAWEMPTMPATSICVLPS